MSIALLYWILYIIAVVFGFGFADRARPYWWGGSLLTAILFFLLGWRVFGFPLHG